VDHAAAPSLDLWAEDVSASHRFNNELRYRHKDHPDQTRFTPPYVLGLVAVDLAGECGLKTKGRHERQIRI
jgi:hypothetical protein